MSDDPHNVLGFALLLIFLVGMPASCEVKARRERAETEAICRRAIERNYSVPAEQAQKVIEAQRAWEGR